MYATPEAVRLWRERHDVSRWTLAQISGVPYKTLESWETGRRPVHQVLVKKTRSRSKGRGYLSGASRVASAWRGFCPAALIGAHGRGA